MECSKHNTRFDLLVVFTSILDHIAEFFCLSFSKQLVWLKPYSCVSESFIKTKS